MTDTQAKAQHPTHAPHTLSRIYAVPWGLVAALALVAPWMLGGRAAAAYPVLAGLAWSAALAGLLAVLVDYRDWRRYAEYERRRGGGRPNPLRAFGRGLLWSLPLWLFMGLLVVSAFNPAYTAGEGGLVLREFNPDLPLIIDPTRSRPGLIFLTGLIAMLGILGNRACRPPGRWMRWLLVVLLLNAVVLAAVGFVYRFIGNGLLLGKYEPRAGYFFATFYYKNHWAAYAILYCGVAAGFFFRDLPRWFTHARQAGSGGLALIAILFLGLSLPVVESRSGILLFAAFSGCFLITLYRRIPTHGRAPRIISVATGALALAGIVYLSLADLQSGWLRTEKQMEQNDSVIIDEIRAFHAPEVCFAMIGARPLFGWGYLSYDPLFPVYATDYFRDDAGALRMDMEFAHNDWLQHTAEFGLLGMGLLFLGLALNFIAAGLRIRGFILIALLLLGAFAAWDFPFSNPAVLANAAALSLIGRRRS